MMICPLQASPCWHPLCWCLPGWAFSRRHCTRSTGNTPGKRSSTMLVESLFLWGHTQSQTALGGSNISVSDVFSASLQHCLPLPGFLLLFTDIYNHGALFSQTGESRRRCFALFFGVPAWCFSAPQLPSPFLWSASLCPSCGSTCWATPSPSILSTTLKLYQVYFHTVECR